MIRLLDNSRYAAMAQPAAVPLAPQPAPRAGWVGLSRRSPQTTDTARWLSDLESAVVNGLITPADADRLFGRQSFPSPSLRNHWATCTWTPCPSCASS